MLMRVQDMKVACLKCRQYESSTGSIKCTIGTRIKVHVVIQWEERTEVGW